ncbi:MAG: Rrf2 family transcriptional regulator [Verrucomicrobiota bacterium]
MFIYGKTATNAIAVMSYLAADETRRVGSAVIAKARNISPVLTAKLLTQLANAGFLLGQPGPGGGYRLIKKARDIRLIDIVKLFEQIDNSSRCPFGAGWCGNQEPCPLHDTITSMTERNRRFLEQTRLSVFRTKTETPKLPKSRLKSSVGKTSSRAKSLRSGNSST